MSFFRKISLTLALPVVLGGCGPKRGTANPEDYYPLIQVALAAGETAALIGRNEAIKAGNFGGCVSAESLAAGFGAAGQTLGGRLRDQVVFPALEVDVSDCLALRANEAQTPVVVSTKIAGYVSDPESEEDAESSASEDAEEDLEAEETESEAAESLTEPESFDAVSQDTSDAAVLVETIAGVTLVAVLHYANKLKTANCKKGTVAMGAVHYVNGMIKPIADQIANPDGKISVAAVTVDFLDCSGS